MCSGESRSNRKLNSARPCCSIIIICSNSHPSFNTYSAMESIRKRRLLSSGIFTCAVSGLKEGVRGVSQEVEQAALWVARTEVAAGEGQGSRMQHCTVCWAAAATTTADRGDMQANRCVAQYSFGGCWRQGSLRSTAWLDSPRWPGQLL